MAQKYQGWPGSALRRVSRPRQRQHHHKSNVQQIEIMKPPHEKTRIPYDLRWPIRVAHLATQRAAAEAELRGNGIPVWYLSVSDWCVTAKRGRIDVDSHEASAW